MNKSKVRSLNFKIVEYIHNSMSISLITSAKLISNHLADNYIDLGLAIIINGK